MTSDEGDGVGRILRPSCLVPDGKYDVRYAYYETQICFGGSKVTIHFSIVNHEKYAGSEIARYYNVRSLSGLPRKYGDFDVESPNCKLVREYGRIVDEPDRLDRISYASFGNKRILVRVRTVISDSNRKLLAKEEQYSVIAELIREIPNNQN